MNTQNGSTLNNGIQPSESTPLNFATRTLAESSTAGYTEQFSPGLTTENRNFIRNGIRTTFSPTTENLTSKDGG